MAPASVARQQTEEAFLDAAERLLVERRATRASRPGALAEEAGANHGLVHYYFGSMENLLARVLERFTERLIERQRAMYAAPDVPFIEKWRTAMRYLDADREYQKVWCELQALAWNRPELRERVAHVDAEWRAVLTRGVRRAARALRLDMPLDALVVARDHLQRGHHPRAAVGHRDRAGASCSTWIDGWLDGGGRAMTTIDGRAAREQTRARYPDEEGYVERDGVRIFYEVYGDGRADGPAAADLVDHPLAPLEGADPLPRAPLPRRHVRRPRQRPLGPPGRRSRPTPSASSPPTPSP